MSVVPPPALRLQVDDLTGAPTLSLIAQHLASMRDTCALDSVHALDADDLRSPTVTMWSAWSGDDLAGIGALKLLGDGRGELKSMRVDDRFLGTGVGRALVRHIIVEADRLGLVSLWLETGAEARFEPARRLYASEGFVTCEPFADYRPDPLSVFMTRLL